MLVDSVDGAKFAANAESGVDLAKPRIEAASNTSATRQTEMVVVSPFCREENQRS